MPSTYTEYVDHISSRYPTLTSFATFLKTGAAKQKHTSIIRTIDISNDATTSQIKNVTLPELLHHVNGNIDSRAHTGTVVVLEDPDAMCIEVLGASMDLDPLFFAGHVSTTYEDFEKGAPPPFMTRFPSQVSTPGFINIHGHKVLDLGKEKPPEFTHCKLAVPGNISRKVRPMQALSGRQLALLRTCTSVYLKVLSTDYWVCLILVDSSARDITVIKSESTSELSPSSRVVQSLGRIRADDVQKMPSYSSFNDGLVKMDAEPSSLGDYLVNLFKTKPPGLNVRSPSILSLAYYPLRIAIAEWMLYTFLMSGYVKYYEYTFNNFNQRIGDAENRDFVELHRWRRRSKQSLHKLQLLAGFVSHWRGSIPPSEEINNLLQDIHHIRDLIQIYTTSLEAKGAIITAMIQILDSRRSTEEAINITHLTYIALVFIPLSFTASIFSMGDEYIPGGKDFWVYFATAVPMTLLILALSRLSRRFQVPWGSSMVDWSRRLRHQNHPSTPV